MSQHTENLTTEERISLIRDALHLLGAAWRNNWSNFDGRTLRHQLDEIDSWFTAERIPSVEDWAAEVGIDPETGTWR